MTDIRDHEDWGITKGKGLVVISYAVLQQLVKRAVGWCLNSWSIASIRDVHTVLAQAPFIACYDSDDVLWDSSWRGLISMRAMRDRSRGLSWYFYVFLPSPRAWNFIVPDWPGRCGGPTLKLASFYPDDEEDEPRIWAAEQFPWFQRRLRRNFIPHFWSEGRSFNCGSPGPENLNYFRVLPGVNQSWFMDKRYARAEEIMMGRKLVVCQEVRRKPFEKSYILPAEWVYLPTNDGEELAAILGSYDRVENTPSPLGELREDQDYLIFANGCWWLLHHPSP